MKLGNTLCEPFNLSNGVRQGRITSILFNIYMDILSTILNKVSIGYNLNNVYINHLFYVDDSVILTLSPLALQLLWDYSDTLKIWPRIIN